MSWRSLEDRRAYALHLLQYHAGRRRAHKRRVQRAKEALDAEWSHANLSWWLRVSEASRGSRIEARRALETWLRIREAES